MFIEFDLKQYPVLAALLSDCKDFCRDRSNMCHFLRQTTPEMDSVFETSGTEKHLGRRDLLRELNLTNPEKPGVGLNLIYQTKTSMPAYLAHALAHAAPFDDSFYMSATLRPVRESERCVF